MKVLRKLFRKRYKKPQVARLKEVLEKDRQQVKRVAKNNKF